MRKRRAIIFDDEPVALLVLRDFFETRGYDVMTFPEPAAFPFCCSDCNCANKAPCSDILLTDFMMPGMNGVDLLRWQARKGCRLTSRNKAVLTGFTDSGTIGNVSATGAVFFEKPVLFDDLGRWVDECEGRMDLSIQLDYPRKEDRLDDSREISYAVSAADSSVCRGAVVNLSPSGLCVRVSSPLARQASVTIRTPLPITSPVALVRWLEDAGDGAYLVGLQCVPPQ
jgi:CheY-like chemotaxis protein